jgi:hypothetical protein
MPSDSERAVLHDILHRLDLVQVGAEVGIIWAWVRVNHGQLSRNGVCRIDRSGEWAAVVLSASAFSHSVS